MNQLTVTFTFTTGETVVYTVEQWGYKSALTAATKQLKEDGHRVGLVKSVLIEKVI